MTSSHDPQHEFDSPFLNETVFTDKAAMQAAQVWKSRRAAFELESPFLAAFEEGWGMMGELEGEEIDEYNEFFNNFSEEEFDEELEEFTGEFDSFGVEDFLVNEAEAPDEEMLLDLEGSIEEFDDEEGTAYLETEDFYSLEESTYEEEPIFDEERFIESEEDIETDEEIDWTVIESEQVPDIPAGREEISQVPFLRRHNGIGPDLILSWNDMTGRPQSVDVVVHLHGYSLRAGKPLHLTRDIVPRSGLDWFDPERSDSVPSRTRPTLALLPRGHFFKGKSGRAYTFPALVTESGLRQLIDFGLSHFAQRIGATNVVLRRLILTAHSGGGAALLRLLRHNDPHEVHIFDGLYQDPSQLIRWSKVRIAKDQEALAAGEPLRRYMSDRGGALRILYGSSTKRHSLTVDRFLAATIPSRSELAKWYRVEQTSIAHLRIPPMYGWHLLADASADLPNTSRPPLSARETPLWEEEALQVPPISDLRQRIVAVAKTEWKNWDYGRRKETQQEMKPALQKYWRTVRQKEKDVEEVIQKRIAWSAAFISWVMHRAGSGSSFEYSSLHTAYVNAAKQWREAGDDSKFWAYRITEAKPELGDVVINDRCEQRRDGRCVKCYRTNYDNVGDRNKDNHLYRKSHGDIVVEIDHTRNRIRVIGGNVKDSVDAKWIVLTPQGYLPERNGDGCQYIAVLKPPIPGHRPVSSTSGSSGSSVPTSPITPSTPPATLSLPRQLLEAVRRGLITVQLAFAILSGEHDENKLTDMIFFARYPERDPNQKIQPHEQHLAREWMNIRDQIVRPNLKPVKSTTQSTGTPKLHLSPSEEKALRITTTFETGRPMGFDRLAGNFDGTGLSFGLLQWNISKSSLQPLLLEFSQNHPQQFNAVFGPHASELRQVLAQPSEKQLQWAISINHPPSGNSARVIEPWVSYFARLGRDPIFQQIQLKYARKRIDAAISQCRQLGLKSERGLALIFDNVTQNGPAWMRKNNRAALIQQRQSVRERELGRSLNERERLEIIANVVADTVKPKWRERVRQRRMIIVTGRGNVRGQPMENFGLTDQPFE